MKVFSFVGWSGSGKTTLIVRLIRVLREKNKKVTAAKGALHKYTVEPESKDTFKFLEAGSLQSLLVSKTELLTIERLPLDQMGSDNMDVLEILKTRYGDYDYLFFEGLTSNDIPIIEVFETNVNISLKYPLNRVRAIVTTGPESVETVLALTGEHGIAVFDSRDITNIIRFMEEYDE